jgi:tetratricopeptide (TPR) repeat protein
LTAALFYLEGAESALQYLEKIPTAELNGDGLLLKANLLETIGRRAEAERTLDQGLLLAASRPRVVQQAVLMLLRLNREEDGLNLLERAIRVNPQDLDLPLAKAIVLGLLGRYSLSEKTLREIELRWPEWDRVYLAHGLLLERSGRPGEARQKLQTAVALGSQDPALRCALARLAGSRTPAPECTCLTGLEQMLVPGCVRQQ